MATQKPVSKSKGDASNGEAAPKKSKMKLLIIALLAVVLLGAGGGGAWYFFKMRGASNTAEAAPPPKPSAAPIFVPLEPFTVNLQPENGEHYLQTSITLQTNFKEEGDLFKLYTPQVRNRILLLLSSKKPSEITTVEGKKKLAEEIVTAVNLPFQQGGRPQNVNSVLFVSFIIQ
ncbi:MAG: fliL [Burkholderiaceae bacterium]|nr:fliL [Burkholderiaceae bacterium]